MPELITCSPFHAGKRYSIFHLYFHETTHRYTMIHIFGNLITSTLSDTARDLVRNIFYVPKISFFVALADKEYASKHGGNNL